jgi:hypothetical protein
MRSRATRKNIDRVAAPSVKIRLRMSYCGRGGKLKSHEEKQLGDESLRADENSERDAIVRVSERSDLCSRWLRAAASVE